MYIVNEVFTWKCLQDEGIILPHKLKKWEPIVTEIFKDSQDVWRGVWNSIEWSAAVGGMMGGV
jgi:hypothetical protein